MPPTTIADMWGPIIGSEAIAAGQITRGALRWNYTAIHPDVYLQKDSRRTLYTDIAAAWLWTRRRGIVAGRAAAALHGVMWIPDTTPVELIANHRRPRRGVIVREQQIGDDEVVAIGRLPVTSAARTALDLARQLPLADALAHVDALARATKVTADEVQVLAARYRSTRGMQTAHTAIRLMDGGAAAPQESRLRLQLIQAGLPRPATSIPVRDQFWEAEIPIGWPGPKAGVGFFEPDRTDRYRAVQDTETQHLFQRCGWFYISALPDHPASPVVRYARDALRRRGWP